MLIFLVATFLGITIPCVGITAAGMRHTIGGKLELWIEDISVLGLFDEYQRSSFFPVPTNAIITMRETPDFSIP